MSRMIWPRGKMLFLLSILVLWLLIGVSVKMLVIAGFIAPLPPTPVIEQFTDQELSLAELTGKGSVSMDSAYSFLKSRIVRPDGHVNLVFPINSSRNNFDDSNYTNSEAVSYFMLISATMNDRSSFDTALNFATTRMAHPDFGYLMWRLNDKDVAVGNDRNIASDADLRAISALAIARQSWPSGDYSSATKSLAKSMERVAITPDFYFAPYGGVRDGALWTADEVWLSYSDFNAFRFLSKEYGNPWTRVYDNMKSATLKSQLPSGLYNSVLASDRKTFSSLDGNNSYSINSLWVMVRASESQDKDLIDSSRKSLAVYKRNFVSHGRIVTSYDSLGNPLSRDESPWAYALVARAAINLGDEDFARSMIDKLLSYQDDDSASSSFGAFIEGSEGNLRSTQFTQQESLLTLQRLVKGV
jgi:hypothetical protein